MNLLGELSKKICIKYLTEHLTPSRSSIGFLPFLREGWPGRIHSRHSILQDSLAGLACLRHIFISLRGSLLLTPPWTTLHMQTYPYTCEHAHIHNCFSFHFSAILDLCFIQASTTQALSHSCKFPCQLCWIEASLGSSGIPGALQSHLGPLWKPAPLRSQAGMRGFQSSWAHFISLRTRTNDAQKGS